MSIIEFIRDRSHYYNCPVCGRNLLGCAVRMLNHRDERFTVQVTCAACRVAFIVVLAIPSAIGESRLDDDDELVIQEVVPAAGLEARPPAAPIEADEILEVHLLLKDFEGSFDELLKTPHR